MTNRKEKKLGIDRPLPKVHFTVLSLRKISLKKKSQKKKKKKKKRGGPFWPDASSALHLREVPKSEKFLKIYSTYGVLKVYQLPAKRALLNPAWPSSFRDIAISKFYLLFQKFPRNYWAKLDLAIIVLQVIY